MIRRTFAVSFALVSLVGLAGCAKDSAEDVASAESEISSGYGYEMFPVRPSDPSPPAASVPAEVQGRVAPEIVRDVLRSGLPALRACERLSSERREPPPGELRPRVWVRNDGGVARVSVPEAPRELGACVERAMTGLRFPRSTGGTFEVVVPVAFGTGG